jgi:hypothetical protein
MRHPRLLDNDHVLVKICSCSEHSLTVEECRDRRDHLDHAIRLLEYNQEPRGVPNTVYCKVCNAAGKEIQTTGRLGPLWSLPEGWVRVTRHDNVLDQAGTFCACPAHREFE